MPRARRSKHLKQTCERQQTKTAPTTMQTTTDTLTDIPSYLSIYGVTEAEYDAVCAEMDRSDELTGPQKAARSRKEKRACATTPYGRLLLALRTAQQASDSAKRTAANGLHIRDYDDGSRYARANYRRSRAARESRYEAKEDALAEAVTLATAAGVVCGYKDGVLYFELATGQASFHSSGHGAADYAGEWDGIKGMTGSRIEEAIALLTAGFVPEDMSAAYTAAVKVEAQQRQAAEQQRLRRAKVEAFRAKLVKQRNCTRPVVRNNKPAGGWWSLAAHVAALLNVRKPDGSVVTVKDCIGCHASAHGFGAGVAIFWPTERTSPGHIDDRDYYELGSQESKTSWFEQLMLAPKNGQQPRHRLEELRREHAAAKAKTDERLAWVTAHREWLEQAVTLAFPTSVKQYAKPVEVNGRTVCLPSRLAQRSNVADTLERFADRNPNSHTDAAALRLLDTLRHAFENPLTLAAA